MNLSVLMYIILPFIANARPNPDAHPEKGDVSPQQTTERFTFCEGELLNGEYVVTVTDQPQRALDLPRGTHGVAVCNSTLYQMVFVCFDGWHAGNARTAFCEFPPLGQAQTSNCPSDAGWWVRCEDIRQAGPQPPSPPLSPPEPSPPPGPPPHPNLPPGSVRHWGLLVAGSRTWGNYRHQADVYHAYQLLKANGIPDETIVVMHYDDIANSPENPHPGKVINAPDGPNVYEGVPKDYVGDDVTAETFLAVLRGDKQAVAGKGSGKVISSNAHDKVFVYYADHGAPGILGMPTGPFLYGKDLVDTLIEKANDHGFMEMVMYVEACESGSLFEGILPTDLNVFVTTAANAVESSWGCYCPGMSPAPPEEYNTCLGDKFSVSWLEDAEAQGANSSETLEEQYLRVKNETGPHRAPGAFQPGSHVMQFGTLSIGAERVESWIGVQNSIANVSNASIDQQKNDKLGSSPSMPTTAVDGKGNVNCENCISHGAVVNCGQHSAMEYHFQGKLQAVSAGSAAHAEALKELDEMHKAQERVDMLVPNTFQKLAKNLIHTDGASEDPTAQWMDTIRPKGQSLVDDWGCFKDSISQWESVCGQLGVYGIRFSRVFANACNYGVKASDIRRAAEATCILTTE